MFPCADACSLLEEVPAVSRDWYQKWHAERSGPPLQGVRAAGERDEETDVRLPPTAQEREVRLGGVPGRRCTSLLRDVVDEATPDRADGAASSTSTDSDSEGEGRGRRAVLELHELLPEHVAAGAEEFTSYAHPGFENDIYGWLLFCYTRDPFYASQAIPLRVRAAHIIRFVNAQLILLACIMTQGLALHFTKFITRQMVKPVREVYAKFEAAMHGGGGFGALSAEDQAGVCQIPLSHPTFTSLICLIWTLISLGEVRRMCETLSTVLCVNLPDEAHGVFGVDLVEDEVETGLNMKTTYIRGMARTLKVLIVVNVIVPSFTVSAMCWWFGMRMLLVTDDFGNLITNTMALSFIVEQRKVFFDLAATRVTKQQMVLTRFVRPDLKAIVDVNAYIVAPVAWGTLSLVVVALYIFVFQQVLPNYQWDTQDVCSGWVAELSDMVVDS